jgi:SAM-dependent methyltransferase
MIALDNVRRSAYYRLYGVDGYLDRSLGHGARVLDVGCSDGRGSEVLRRRGAHGVDIYRPALMSARDAGRRVPVTQADVRELPYRDDSFDAVVALDVVEHFDKPEALRVLLELERVARSLVVVVTPSGFVPQPPTEDEPWQEHRCGFEADEFENLGYDVAGLGGPAALRGAYGSFRWGAAGKLVAAAAIPAFKQRPESAYALLAVKESSRG